MKDFIKRYGIIIFLVVIIFVLAFVKSYFGNKVSEVSDENKESYSNNEDYNGWEQNSEIEDNSNEIGSLNTGATSSDSIDTSSEILEETEDIDDETLSIKNEEDELLEQRMLEDLFEEYLSLNTDTEREKFLNSLTSEQKNELLNNNSTQEYELKNILPYETDTFVAEKYAAANVLIIKAKGSDFDKSESDAQTWINSASTNPSEIVLIWSN